MWENLDDLLFRDKGGWKEKTRGNGIPIKSRKGGSLEPLNQLLAIEGTREEKRLVNHLRCRIFGALDSESRRQVLDLMWKNNGRATLGEITEKLKEEEGANYTISKRHEHITALQSAHLITSNETTDELCYEYPQHFELTWLAQRLLPRLFALIDNCIRELARHLSLSNE